MKSYAVKNGVRPTITTAEEGTIGLVAGDKGAIFYNTDTDSLRTWDGAAFQNAGEDLGNPTVDGYVLSSTIAGVRSWVDNTPTPEVPLYAFTSFTFTPAGATYRYGPTLSQCNTAYSGALFLGDTALFNAIGGIQHWTVPETATYTFTTVGAGGGSDVGGATGGSGAKVVNSVSLSKGDIIKMMVGQIGLTDAAAAKGGGGGGGSFVYVSGNPLFVSGGGGGGVQYNGGTVIDGLDASLTTSGTGNVGGTAGGGGGSSSQNGNYGSGGGGITGDGYDWDPNSGGHSFVNGGDGGTGQYNTFGGFGGGGGASWSGGGGGGGYSGGSGGNGASVTIPAGGGGSYSSVAGGTFSISGALATGYITILKL